MHVQGRCRSWLGNRIGDGEAAVFQDDPSLPVKGNQFLKARRLTLGIALVVRQANDCASEKAREPTALEELQQRNAELRAAVAARDAFIAVAAHELRNPMTPMIGQIDLLLRGLRAGRYTPQQIEQRLERVRLVMNHYLKRATTLLDVSRITTGKLILAPTSFDLAD